MMKKKFVIDFDDDGNQYILPFDQKKEFLEWYKWTHTANCCWPIKKKDNPFAKFIVKNLFDKLIINSYTIN